MNYYKHISLIKIAFVGLILIIVYSMISDPSPLKQAKIIGTMKFLLPLIAVYFVLKFSLRAYRNRQFGKWAKSVTIGYNDIEVNGKFVIPKRYSYLEGRDSKKPINFGIKTVWIAIESEDYLKISNFLELINGKDCDWIEGTIRAYCGEIFVTPNINGWVLIHGLGLPTPDGNNTKDQSVHFLNKLSYKFGNAFLFGNHRVSNTYFWMKSARGKLKRLYVFADGTGEIFGEESILEKSWNLIDANHPDIDKEPYWETHKCPGEDEVIEMSELWSINPMNIENFTNVGKKGYCGQLQTDTNTA